MIKQEDGTYLVKLGEYKEFSLSDGVYLEHTTGGRVLYHAETFFGAVSRLQQRLTNGEVRCEIESPSKKKGDMFHNFLERVENIDDNKVVFSFKPDTIEVGRTSEGFISVTAKGTIEDKPEAQALVPLMQLDKPLVRFGIRAVSRLEKVDGVDVAKQLRVITWDLVPYQ